MLRPSRRTLKRWLAGTSAKGFTIVELLIVIVVIAILAAISVVAYTGINQRAYLARVDSEVNSLAKQLEMERVKEETYARSDSELRGVIHATGLWEATRTADWNYLYCSTESEYVLLPTNKVTEEHNSPKPLEGETWRIFSSSRGWQSIAYNSSAHPDQTVASDLCTQALPGHSYKRWFASETL